MMMRDAKRKFNKILMRMRSRHLVANRLIRMQGSTLLKMKKMKAALALTLTVCQWKDSAEYLVHDQRWLPKSMIDDEEKTDSIR